MPPAAHESLWGQYYRESTIDIDPGALEREDDAFLGCGCLSLLVSYWTLAHAAPRGGFLTHSLRYAINADKFRKAQEALGPSAPFAGQVLRHLLQQQAHSCCLQCQAIAAAA